LHRGLLNERNGREFDEMWDRDTIKHLPRSTHPRTEDGSVVGLLVMGVLRLVIDRLGGRDAADHEDAEHQQNGERSRDETTCH
jgi:hypothetical protein